MVATSPEIEVFEADERLAAPNTVLEDSRHANVRAQRVEAVGFGGECVSALRRALL
jgi:hypothetical protein